MNRTQIGTLLVAATLVLAGCAGGIGGGTSASGTNDDGGTAATDEQATMHFYVSDRPGAIEEFEHLNVTVTSVTLYEETDDDGADGNDSDADDEDVDAEADADAEAEVDGGNASVDVSANASAGMDDASENESDSENESESEDDGDLEKTTYDVEDTTVDLTELQGANASLVDTMNVSAGTYERVVLHVSETDGTLTDGTQVNVKLPSEKLQLNTEFTVEAGSDTAFVFDVMVHEAGNSGKYVLRPVVSESGTGDQVEIDDVAGGAVPTTNGSAAVEVGDDGADEDERENESESESEREDDLTAAFEGTLAANSTTTLVVTDDDGPVANATVEVNGETVGETDADGTIAIDVGAAEELEIAVTKGDAEYEFETDLTADGDAAASGDDGDESAVAPVA